ncbi:MAG: transporter, partial [Vicinamibacteraceae bacterium]
ERGHADVSAAAKIALPRVLGGRMDMALLPEVSLPGGTGEFTRGSVEPSFGFLWALSPADGWDLSGVAQVAAHGAGDGGRLRATAVSAALGRTWHDRGSVYVEAYRISEGALSRWALDAGASHLFGDDVAADVSAGRSITPSGGWFVAAGAAFRHLRR